MRISNLSTIAVICLLSNVAASGGEPADDSILQALAQAGRSDADRDRDKHSRPDEVLAFFGVKPGMIIADLMSGGGYYSEIMAYAVGPQGRVIAHNNTGYLKFAGDEPDKRFNDNRLPNVERLNTELETLGLPEGELDMIVLVMSYHDIYWEDAEYDWALTDRDQFFAGLQSSLKPGGIVAIVDHAAKSNTGTTAVNKLHRIDEEFARKDFEQAGFHFEGASDVLRNPDDARTLGVFDDAVKGQTDRFVYRFSKISTDL